MAREKQTKPKEMFKPYDADSVPDVMPLPELAFVKSTKGQDTAVPKLNEHQRSWILDVGVRDEDLASLTGKAANEVYNRVKADAFKAKAFQHTPQAEDRAEEDAILRFIATWKMKHASAKKPVTEDADEAEEEDEDGRALRLRGYSKTAWRMIEQAIQKVISNKRNALKVKARQAVPAQRQPQENDDQESFREAPALAKLVGITAYSGRDKFRDDRHEEIHQYSKTLLGPTNAGGKFRKAEALLWAKEDAAVWDAAAAVEDGVDWVETEAVPDGIVVPETFRKLNPPLVQQTLNAMYAWAEEPLKKYLATREAPTQRVSPVFPLSTGDLDDQSHKALAQTLTEYLVASFDAAFDSRQIPWADIVADPEHYYDVTRFEFSFALAGVADLSRAQVYELAGVLAAGAGTQVFFRAPTPSSRAGSPTRPHSPPPRTPPAPHTPPPRTPTPPRTPSARPQTPTGPGSPRREAEEARLKHEAKEARLRREAEEETARLKQAEEEEVARLRREAEEEEARLKQGEEAARLKREAEEEAGRLKREAEEESARLVRKAKEEEARLVREAEEAARPSKEGGRGGPKKGGKKRKAEEQLAREEGAVRRTGRPRQTPEEAKLEREKKVAATGGRKTTKPR
ncbi:hypothetical protein DFH09DRAFT_1099861 [Mycena vulgaris]|nr:hypothetical protein DFH09DRAFT_1099861 [Mycena vulgaris]